MSQAPIRKLQEEKKRGRGERGGEGVIMDMIRSH
jgi:hypothetical protein